MAREVVVTGVGLVTPLGATAPETAAAWRAGTPVARAPLPDLAGTPLAAAPAARLPAFDPGARLGSRRLLKYMSEAAVLGCVAAHEACAAAAAGARFAPERVGLYAAAGLATASVSEVRGMVEAAIGPDGQFSCQRLGRDGLAAANPLVSFKILPNMPPCLISIVEGIKGPNLIFTPWEGQGGAAILEGWQAVASGEVEAALVGAADNAAHPATLVYLRQAGLLRPDEFPAAAAAYLVLEAAASARRDGHPVQARLVHVDLAPDPASGGAGDPLADRFGRTFAAAPALQLALACLTGGRQVTVSGADHQRFSATLAAGT